MPKKSAMFKFRFWSVGGVQPRGPPPLGCAPVSHNNQPNAQYVNVGLYLKFKT
jgi:hypothetical protein